MSAVLAASSVQEPGAVQYVAQAAELVVCLVAVFVLARRQRARPTQATGWAMAMFGVLIAVLVAGYPQVQDDGSLLHHGYVVVLVSVLVAFPYLLVRFAMSLGALGRRAHLVAAGLTALQLVATLASPRFPAEDETYSTWFGLYVGLVLLSWILLSVMAAVGLWSVGRGQPSVVRHRMRTLSAGAVLLALALVGSVGTSESSSAAGVVTTLLAVASICMLVVAFVVPGWLRAAWRASDLVDLAAAERGLMSALTPQSVAAEIVPALLRLFGARGAALVDGQGRVVEVRGMAPERVAEVHREMARAVSTSPVVASGAVFGCRLTDGWLVIEGGAFAPVFGPAELSLLDRIGSFVDLALERCRLFEQEDRSRTALEAANAELQTLVYSVSHDLRNPIISVLGYLDVLRQEHAGQLTGDGAHYLERISVNALYMQSLIQDLLELSRIGRSEPASTEVDLGALAESVAQEVRVMHPRCRISVSEGFPTVWVSELRARQLLTNLVDNAAKHSLVDAQVTVAALPGQDGSATILIADNGRGVPPEYREKAFDVFERLDAAHTDVPGTGMGLPICKRIVESLGGTILLDGPPPGTPSGTTVRITLPASAIRTWSSTPVRLKENVS